MTRPTAVLRLALATLVASGATLSARSLPAQEPVVTAESRAEEQELYTVQELDNLLAPVALYPDPILAELFVAATYPDQIQLAKRYIDTYGAENLDDQAWDVSVRAIARYEPVLNMLAERPNWATAVGRAYATQPGDVMASVQNLRRMAKAQGNLQTTEQQRVVVEREYIRIVPAQPRVVYVPVYDPYVVYYRPVSYVSVGTPYWSFGVAYPIGAWLSYDLDWSTRAVFYHGWGYYGPTYYTHSWYHVSRPYIAYSPIYMGPRVTVVLNFGVRRRYVNYGGFDYYNSVHRSTRWDRRGMPGRGYYGSGNGRGYGTGYGNGNDNGYGNRDKPVAPDRYGVPRGSTAGVGRTAKPDNDLVPSVNRTATAGRTAPSTGSRPGNGSVGNPRPGRDGDADRDRGNGSGRVGNGGRTSGGSDISRAPVANEDRVKPVRVGGMTGSNPGRGSVSGSAGASNGTWNPRVPRDDDPVRIPRASGTRSDGNGGGSISASRSAPRYGTSAQAGKNESRAIPRTDRSYEPRAEAPRSTRSYEAPRATRSYEPRAEAPRTTRSYEAPRATPRYEPRAEPRSAPRVERSAPRESAPRASAPRSSEPRMSAPRSGGSGASRGSGGGVPRAPKRDRG